MTIMITTSDEYGETTVFDTPAECAAAVAGILGFDEKYLRALFEQVESSSEPLDLGVDASGVSWRVSSTEYPVLLTSERVGADWVDDLAVRRRVSLDEGVKIMAALAEEQEMVVRVKFKQDRKFEFEANGVRYSMRAPVA